MTADESQLQETGDGIVTSPIERNYPGSNGHYQERCEFGMVHAQCRCPSPNKTTMRVVCNIPATHRVLAASQSPLLQKPTGPADHLVSLRGVDIDRLRDWLTPPMSGLLGLDSGRITFEALEGGLIVRTYGDGE